MGAHVGLGVVELEVDLGCLGIKGQLSPQTPFAISLYSPFDSEL